MSWLLNKLDDALERIATPNTSRHGSAAVRRHVDAVGEQGSDSDDESHAIARPKAVQPSSTLPQSHSLSSIIATAPAPGRLLRKVQSSTTQRSTTRATNTIRIPSSLATPAPPRAPGTLRRQPRVTTKTTKAIQSATTVSIASNNETSGDDAHDEMIDVRCGPTTAAKTTSPSTEKSTMILLPQVASETIQSAFHPSNTDPDTTNTHTDTIPDLVSQKLEEWMRKEDIDVIAVVDDHHEDDADDHQDNYVQRRDQDSNDNANLKYRNQTTDKLVPVLLSTNLGQEHLEMDETTTVDNLCDSTTDMKRSAEPTAVKNGPGYHDQDIAENTKSFNVNVQSTRTKEHIQEAPSPSQPKQSEHGMGWSQVDQNAITPKLGRNIRVSKTNAPSSEERQGTDTSTGLSQQLFGQADTPSQGDSKMVNDTNSNDPMIDQASTDQAGLKQTGTKALPPYGGKTRTTIGAPLPRPGNLKRMRRPRHDKGDQRTLSPPRESRIPHTKDSTTTKVLREEDSNVSLKGRLASELCDDERIGDMRVMIPQRSDRESIQPLIAPARLLLEEEPDIMPNSTEKLANSLALDHVGHKARSTITAVPSPDDVQGDLILSGRRRLLANDIPREVEQRNEFDARNATKNWLNPFASFKKEMNCRGTVHVRVLRAQRLPCSVGSPVYADVSLNPWKGKVSTVKVNAFRGPLDDSGVCASWDEDESPVLSMLHAYSGDDSATPSIQIDLKFSPLGVISFSMATLSLACETLLMCPFTERRQWFIMESCENTTRPDLVPLLQVEAMFEPFETFSDQEVVLGGSGSADMTDSIHSRPIQSFDEASESDVKGRESTKDDEGTSHISSLNQSRRGKVKQHRLTLKTFRAPARCCVCKKLIMSGLWRRQAFRCDDCLVDCCGDCRLNVDIKIPCGSEEAKYAVATVIQNKLSLEKIAQVVAPIRFSNNTPSSTILEPTRSPSRGIGTFSIQFIQGFVFEGSYPPEDDPSEILSGDHFVLRKGDYYMRITMIGSNESSRTHTIQNTGKPKFEGEDFRFIVPHYGVEFRVELIDATTDATLGTGLLTTQGLLQEQRDFLIEDLRVKPWLYFREVSNFTARRRVKLSLRYEMKTMSSSQYFSHSRVERKSAKFQKGNIVAIADVLVGLHEDFSSLYGIQPYRCPSKPPDDLDVSLFQRHLARLSEFVEDVRTILRSLQYIVSWQNPLLTGLTFVIFLRSCYRFDTNYVGSLPIFVLVVCMLRASLRRFFGRLRDRFIRKESESRRKAEGVVVDYALHRPLGKVSISVLKGRNIKSREMGLPGHVACHIFWDSTRLLDEERRKREESIDPSAGVAHEIGNTNYMYSTSPQWSALMETAFTKRLRLLVNSSEHSFEESRPESLVDLIFPVLQPFQRLNVGHSLVSWETSKAAFIFQLRSSDVFNVIPGSEYIVGEVSIPLAELCTIGEIGGWFHVHDAGTKTFSLADFDDGRPQVFLKLRWIQPVESSTKQKADQEVSLSVQEEMIRSAILIRQQRHGFLGSSLGAFNTVRGLTNNLLVVQNSLGYLLDIIEASRNALNFTDPLKSSVLLGVMLLLYTFFAIIPIRVIIMVSGLVLYGVNFVSRFTVFNGSINKQQPVDSSPLIVGWLLNAFRGLPTDEDLRKTYFWETRRTGAKEAELYTSQKRKRRLETLWRAQWYSPAERFIEEGEQTFWKSCFVVLQGHRLFWWESLHDFDNAEQPVGNLLLAGHAGVADPSPLELREVEGEEVERLVCLFGRGNQRQERVTVLLPSSEAKVCLEKAIEDAFNCKGD